MNREDIIRMAREAGLGPIFCRVPHAAEDCIERFATLVAEHEREACAKIAETPIGEYDVIVVCGGDPTTLKIPMYLTNKDVAKAIRARGQA